MDPFPSIEFINIFSMFKFLTLISLFNLSISYGQIDSIRKIFLEDRINNVTAKYASYYKQIIIRETNWDTTSRAYWQYLSTKFDTTDLRDIDVSKRTRNFRNIIKVKKQLTPNDYLILKEQIVGHNIERINFEKVVKGNKKKKEDVICLFSQPLLLSKQKLIFFYEEHKFKDGYFEYYYDLYKIADGKFVKYLTMQSYTSAIH